MEKIGKWALAIGFCVLSFALAVRVASHVAAAYVQLSHGDQAILSAVCGLIAILCLAVVAVRKMRSDAWEPADGGLDPFAAAAGTSCGEVRSERS